MDRRSFLLGTGTLALGQLLAGCNQSQEQLYVRLLQGSIPAQVVNEFRADLKQRAKLQFAPVEQLTELFTQLQSWSQQKDIKANEERSPFSLPFRNSQTTFPDLITLGDYWLATAIKQKLIQPLDITNLQQWSSLPPRWQELVRRNDEGLLDPQGKVWAAPYRWGNTVIAYNRDKFKALGWTPSDWSDLWRTELRDRISLLNQPREVIGLTLKKLGQSYNSANLNQVPDLEKQLYALDQQVKFYGDTYLEPLILGDTWLAVGWSTDILPVMQRYQQIAAVVPQSGTALWTDLWVRPEGNTVNTIAEQWINFCWQPQIAQEISIRSKANSPIPVTVKPASIQAGLRNVLLSDAEIFQRSEFLRPLPKATVEQYESLFRSMKK